MEDWQKYIFDPKNPKGFKARKLLEKILKDNNTFLVMDMYYFNELFKNEIWTQDVINELWDKPDDFNELSSNEKMIVFKKNYSHKTYIELLNKKLDTFLNKKWVKLFSKITPQIEKTRYFEENRFKIAGRKTLNINFIDNFNDTILEIEKDSLTRLNNYNCFFLIKERYENHLSNFYNSLKLEKLSVFFINENENIKKEISTWEDLHPIILKEEEDIHQLLDFLVRDIEQENQANNSHQPDIYLDEIDIDNYFFLEDIKLNNLKDKREIYLMGENGDGKTILLQAITLALRGNQNIGDVIDIVKQDKTPKTSLVAKTSDKKTYKYYENPKTQKKSFDSVLGYGIDRFRNDSDKKDEVGYLSLFNKETYLENPEKWLIHLDHKESKGDISEISLALAKDILKDILEREVTIHVTPDKVTFTEKGTTLNFDQLSDGYQSVIIWVCDLISRMSKLQPSATGPSEYSSLVLVDEIGAYLHPKWAYQIVPKLRSWFPKLQFIFTTHNPIVILGASDDAVFYKVYKEEGKTKVSEPINDISDLMLNSLVTSPLFNLPTARPNSFNESNDLGGEDYIYKRIHQIIQQKLQTMPDLVDEDVMKMLEAELDKI